MALACTSPKQVVLKYTTVLAQEIYLQTTAPDFLTLGRVSGRFKSQFTRVISSNPDEHLTWSFEADPDGDFLEYGVSYTTADPDNPLDREFKAYFLGRLGSPGYWIDEDNHVNWTYQADGNTVFSNEQITPFDGHSYSHPSLVWVDEPLVNYGTYMINAISISGGGNYAPAQYYPYSFIWNVYQGGNLVKSGKHNSKTANFPAGEIVVVDANPGHPESKTFDFPTAPLSVELKLKPNTDYSYEVIAKYSDDTEEVIYFFYGIDPTSLCFSEVGECPDNTCKVDCGEHYCCYGSDGIAVHSFVK